MEEPLKTRIVNLSEFRKNKLIFSLLDIIKEDKTIIKSEFGLDYTEDDHNDYIDIILKLVE